MTLVDIARRAGRSLRQAKVRTLLTSLAIGVGAFTITLSLAAGEGGRRFISDVITSNTDPRAVYVQAKQERAEGPQEYGDAQKLELGGGISLDLLKESDVRAIAGVAHVETVVPMYTISVKYVTTPGQDKKYEVGAAMFDPSIKLSYEAGDVKSLTKGEVVLPKEFVEPLGFKDADELLGKTIVVGLGDQNPLLPVEEREFVVAGVAGSSSLALSTQTALQFSEADARDIYTRTYEGTPLDGAYTSVTVRVDDEANVEAVKTTLNDRGYEAMVAEDILGSVFVFINVLQGILLGFGALAIITSIFGIINTQYISVLERTQQIGLMKALGMRRRDVGRLFKLEAAWIGFLGGALGAGLALAGGALANPAITKQLDLGDSHLLVFLPWHLAAVVFGLMLVAIMAGILPARKAAKLDPIEALRTE